eukprot:5334796-Alexandrium_andersonii.AAC.1
MWKSPTSSASAGGRRPRSTGPWPGGSRCRAPCSGSPGWPRRRPGSPEWPPRSPPGPGGGR